MDHKKYCELAKQGKTFWHPEVAQKLICENCIHHNQPMGLGGQRKDYDHPKHSIKEDGSEDSVTVETLQPEGAETKLDLPSKPLMASAAAGVAGAQTIHTKRSKAPKIKAPNASEQHVKHVHVTQSRARAQNVEVHTGVQELSVEAIDSELSSKPLTVAGSMAGAGAVAGTATAVEKPEMAKKKITTSDDYLDLKKDTAIKKPVVASKKKATAVAKVSAEKMADPNIATTKPAGAGMMPRLAKALAVSAGGIVVGAFIFGLLGGIDQKDDLELSINAQSEQVASEPTPSPTSTPSPTPEPTEVVTIDDNEPEEPAETSPQIVPGSGDFVDPNNRYSFNLPDGQQIDPITNSVKDGLVAIASSDLTRDEFGNITSGYELFVSEINNVAEDTSLLTWGFPNDLIQEIDQNDARYLSFGEIPPCVHHIKRLDDGTVLEFWMEKADISSDEHIDVLDLVVDSVQS